MEILLIQHFQQTPIIVFSCHLLFCITSNTQTIPIPIMVAFNQSGAGHYDGVCPKDKVLPSVTDAVKCDCGKNDTSGVMH